MAEIDVHPAGGNTFTVRVTEESSETEHRVTVSGSDLQRLGAGYGSPEEFLRACFEFLLAREPKESILREFDVAVISRYFPEFESEIRRTD
ncbi:MAG: hypothetical protein ACRD02_09875 [Acidimicrobiia bacterium]